MVITPELRIVLEEDVAVRFLEPEERRLIAPGLLIHYCRLSGVGLGGYTTQEWIWAVLHGEVGLIERGGEPVGAAFSLVIDPGNCADVHVVKWGEVDPQDWIRACAEGCRTLIRKYNLLRIEGLAPLRNRGLQRMGEAIGFKKIGRIPKGMKDDNGNVTDTILMVLTEEMLDGGQEGQ